jgi:uncharacterized damage-inducible protein DinB
MSTNRKRRPPRPRSTPPVHRARNDARVPIPQGLHDRLARQLEALTAFLDASNAAAAEVAPADGGWSARENVAHLARHAHAFLARMDLILTEDRPNVGNYRPDRDPEWPDWRTLPLAEALRRLHAARAQLLVWIDGLSDEQVRRTGRHPQFGEWDIARWLDFFLLHEAHHLYFVVRRLAEGSRRPPREA